MADTRMIRVLKGTGGSPRWRPGQLVELPADEAAKWADGNRAVYVDAVPVDELHAVPTGPIPAAVATQETEEAPAGPAAEATPEPPAGNASREEWARFFVDVLEVNPEEIKDLGRDALRDRYAAMDTEA